MADLREKPLPKATLALLQRHKKPKIILQGGREAFSWMRSVVTLDKIFHISVYTYFRIIAFDLRPLTLDKYPQS